jgi:diguanylate cyclase
MIPEYNETMEEATSIVRSALPLAAKHNIPVHPVNYAVLYEYVSKQNAKLCGALDVLFKDAKSVTDESLRKLFTEYISRSDEQAVESVRSVLDGIVSAAMKSIGRVSDESQAYSSVLGGAVSQLSGENLNQDKLILQKLLEATEKMQTTSSQLKKELTESNAELEVLRAEFKRVRRESMSDPLTGVKNRRSFDATMLEYTKNSLDQNQPLCLVIMDIDHFKKINDSFGHVTGDVVLKWAANLMSEAVRGCDLVARYGGEEFALLLPETNLMGASFLAEKIRRKMAEQKLRMADKSIGLVTASFGVALYEQNESIESFISRADGALYRAKEAGRNKVMVDSRENFQIGQDVSIT